MKKIYALSVLIIFGSYAFVTPVGEKATEAQEFAEKSVLGWADKTFEFYDGARFENFAEIPSQEQFIVENKIMMLQEFFTDQESMFKEGKSKKTKEEFDASQKKTSRKIDSLNVVLTKIDPKGKNYEIHFWANIMVSNAVTVYYQHLVKLDSKFNVMSTKITGKIGTQPDGVKILYKKTATIKG